MIEIVAEALIIEAASRAGAVGGKWINICDLRGWCPRLTQDDFDAALTRLAIKQTATLAPEENQKVITADMHDGGLIIGGERKHVVTID